MSKLFFETYRTDVDLAEEIGCHVRTLHRAIKRGEIVGTKLDSCTSSTCEPPAPRCKRAPPRKKGRAAK